MPTRALLVLVMLVLAGCGRSADAPSPDGAAGASSATPGMRPSPGASVRPSFDEPSLVTDFTTGRGRWALDGTGTDDGWLVTSGRRPLVASAPADVEPGAAVLTEVVLTMEEDRGAAGAYCRGDGDRRYELTLSADGRLALFRVDGDVVEELSGDTVPDAPVVGTPALLRLVCEAAGDGAPYRMHVQYNASPLFTVTDDDPLPDDGTDTGVVVRGGARVTLGSVGVFVDPAG